jgi:hypothetical protein
MAGRSVTPEAVLAVLRVPAEVRRTSAGAPERGGPRLCGSRFRALGWTGERFVYLVPWYPVVVDWRTVSWDACRVWEVREGEEAYPAGEWPKTLPEGEDPLGLVVERADLRGLGPSRPADASVEAWPTERVEADPQAEAETGVLYADYAGFCRSRGLRVLSRGGWSRVMGRRFRWREDRRGRRRVRVRVGVRLRVDGLSHSDSS